MTDAPLPEQPPTPATPPNRLRRFVREFRPVVVMLVVLLAARSSLADWNVVPTWSMNPTIIEGDRVFVNKLAYGLKVPFTTWHVARWDAPSRGEIVVFFAPHDGTRMVKRVVGVPGDTVALVGNRLTVNGQPAAYGPADLAVLADDAGARTGQHRFATEASAGDPPHPVMVTPGRPTRADFGPVTVPPGKYLLIGDNRDNSLDSRYWGFVDADQIVGRSGSIVASFDPEAWVGPRWGRFFKSLP